MQDMIQAPKDPRALDGDHIQRFFDDANNVGITARIGTERAGITLRQILATTAINDTLLHLANGSSQFLHLVGLGAQQIECQTRGVLGTNARKTDQGIDQALDGFGDDLYRWQVFRQILRANRGEDPGRQ